jgi:Ca2+-binding EF-hand superfamily protein
MKSIIAITALGLAAAASTLALADGPFGGARHAGVIERLKAADTNGDGMLSREEAAALPRLAERFDAIDANHDGLLTREEMHAWHQAQRGAHGAHGKALLGPNGQLTRDEFIARAAARFDRMDANHDGVVTSDEMHAAFRNHVRGARQ